MKKKKWLIKSMVLSQLLFIPVPQAFAQESEKISEEENLLTTVNRYDTAIHMIRSPKLDNKKIINTFIEEMGPFAVESAKESNILPSIILAEMALKSTWGSNPEVTDYNMFSIEQSNIDSNQPSAFKVYSSIHDSIYEYYSSQSIPVLNQESIDTALDSFPSTYSDEYINDIKEVIQTEGLSDLDHSLIDSEESEGEVDEQKDEDLVDTDTEDEVNNDKENDSSIDEMENSGSEENTEIPVEIPSKEMDIEEEIIEVEKVEEVEEVEEEVENNIEEESKKKQSDIQVSTFSINPSSENEVNYTANVVSKELPIYKLDKGVFKQIDNSKNFYGNQVYGKKEVVNNNETYTLLYSTSSKEIGWILKKGLDIEKVLQTKKEKYNTFITKSGYSIDSKPWGTEGYVNVSRSEAYLNKEIIVVEEQTTRRGTFAKIELDRKVLGWIDKNAFGDNYSISEKAVQYAAIIKNKTAVISTMPTGLNGSKIVGSGNDYFGKKLIVTKEMETKQGTFSFITLNSKSEGWVKKDDLTLEVALSSRNTQYGAKVVTKVHSIDSLPYGVEGFKKIANSRDYYGNSMVVSKEIVTQRGTFSLISLYGKELGWIDKNALQLEEIISQKTTQYAATIKGSNNSIDTWPYGLEGFKTIGRVSDPAFANKKILVTKEIVTSRGTFAYINLNGKEQGWVDRNALDIEKVLTSSTVSYAAKVTTKNNSIDSLPYGIEGFIKVGTSAEYYNNSLVASKEMTTPRGTFVFISYQGKNIGWIDKKALDVETVTNTQSVNYHSEIMKNGYSIDSLPYGITGFTNVSRSNNYLHQKVNVIQEKVTQRGIFALISLNGKTLGWLDKRALSDEIVTKSVFIDPGHGGSESGAVSFGVYEKNLNLTISLLVRDKLQQRGYNVLMSRTTDKYISLVERARMANQTEAEIFVSIHHNALGGTSAHGIESYYYKYDPNYPPAINGSMHNDPARIYQSIKLTETLQKSLIFNTGAYDRGVRSETFAVIRETSIPATLLELGFMTNSAEMKKLTDPYYQNVLADAIASGIDQYLK